MSAAALIARAADARYKRRVRDAIELYGRAVAAARDEKDERRLVHALRHQGEMLFEINDAARAEPLLTEALTLARNGVALTPLELANAVRPVALLKVQARAADAVAMLTEARDLYAEAGVAAGVAEMGRLLARLER